MICRTTDVAKVTASVVALGASGIVGAYNHWHIGSVACIIVVFTALTLRAGYCAMKNAKRLGEAQALDGAEQFAERFLALRNRQAGD